MKTIQDLIGMPLLSVGEGVRIGKLRGLDFDAADGRIRSLFFKGEDGRADGVVSWAAVRSIGADAITIDSLAALEKPDTSPDAPVRPPDIRDRPVVTESGARIGKVSNYDVDEKAGRIVGYHVATGGIFGRLTHSQVSFPHSAIRAFGPDAIIIDDAVIAADVKG